MSALGEWMKQRGWLERGAVPSQRTFDAALRLRGAIRDYLKCEPADCHRKPAIIEALTGAMAPFSLRVAEGGKGGMKLLSAEAGVQAGLSPIVAEIYDGSANSTLDRVKTCAADECQCVFFDRSKPGTRRWCQSALWAIAKKPAPIVSGKSARPDWRPDIPASSLKAGCFLRGRA